MEQPEGGAQTEINALQQLNAELRSCLDHDALTGAWSRPFFESRVRELVAQDVPFAVMMLDVDNFKTVNDTLGHSAGDDLLRRIAAHITESLDHPGDGLARIGGDEFAIILPVSDEINVDERMILIQDLVQGMLQIDGTMHLPVSCSVGVAQRQRGELIEDWHRRSDSAMYIHKKGRRSVKAG